MGVLRIGLRALGWLTVAVATLALLALLVVLAVDRGWQRERVRRLAEAGLGAALEAPVRIGALEGVLHDHVQLRDVTLRGAEGSLLRIGSLDADLELSRLWSERRIVVERLLISGVALHAARDAEGRWRVAGLPEPAPQAEEETAEPPSVSLEIRTLALRDATLQLAWDEAGAASRLAAGLELEARDLVWPWRGVAPRPSAARARLALAPSLLRGRSIESGVLELALDGAELRLEPSSLQSAFGTLHAEGEVELGKGEGWPAPRNGRLEARVSGLDLAPVTGDPRWASALNGRVVLTGVPEGGGVEVKGTLGLEPSRLAGLDIARASARGSASTARRHWVLEEAAIESELGRVSASGRGGLGGAERLELVGQDLRLARLPEAWRPPVVAGRADLRAVLEGPWDDPRGTLALDAVALRSGELAADTLELRATALGERRLRIDALTLRAPDLAVASEGPGVIALEPGGVHVESLRLVWPGGALALAGRVRDGRLAPMHVDVTSLDVARVGTLAGADVELGGALTAQLRATGPLRRPQLEGAALWREPRLGAAVAERITLEMHTEAGALVGTARLFDEGQERLRADGLLPWAALRANGRRLLTHPQATLRLRSDRLDVAWLARAVPSELAKLGGRLDLDLSVQGGTPRPALSGSVRLAEGKLAATPLGVTFGPSEGTARVEGAHAILESLRVASGEGVAELEGELGWSPQGLGALRLDARFERFAFSRTPTLQADLDGTLRVAGRHPELRVQGAFTLRDAQIGLPELSDPLLKEVRVRGLPDVEEPTSILETSAPSPGILEQAEVELSLDIPRNTWVRGRGADVEIEGALRLTKKPGEDPVHLGTVQVVRGRYRFQGRTFQVERGVATFTGTHELDPELDFVATHRVRDVKLRALVTGRASAPNLVLESEPPLDATDLLSYLAFGRPARELGEGQSMRLEATAAQIAGQLAAGTVTSALTPALPLDLIDVSLAEGGTGATVEIGKYLREDVFVRYGRSFGGDVADHVRIEWRFRPRWSVESEIGSTGSAGADVIWSIDY